MAAVRLSYSGYSSRILVYVKTFILLSNLVWTARRHGHPSNNNLALASIPINTQRLIVGILLLRNYRELILKTYEQNNIIAANQQYSLNYLTIFRAIHYAALP